jgi:hypothetical protein
MTAGGYAATKSPSEAKKKHVRSESGEDNRA